MRSQIYKDLTISLPSCYPLFPLITTQIFFAPLFSNPSMCFTGLGLSPVIFIFLGGYFFSCIVLFLSLVFSLSHSAPFSSIFLSSAEWYLVMALQPCFVYPGLGCVLQQAWRVPCLRSGFRDYPLFLLSLPLSCFQVKPPAISRPTHTYRHHFALVMAGERR